MESRAAGLENAKILVPALAASAAAILRTYLLFASFQVDLGALGATFLFGAANLIGLLPLHGFGGLGPKQVGIAGTLVLLGMGAGIAAALTLLFQASIVVFVALIAFLGYGLRMVEREDQVGGST